MSWQYGRCRLPSLYQILSVRWVQRLAEILFVGLGAAVGTGLSTTFCWLCVCVSSVQGPCLERFCKVHTA